MDVKNLNYLSNFDKIKENVVDFLFHAFSSTNPESFHLFNFHIYQCTNKECRFSEDGFIINTKYFNSNLDGIECPNCFIRLCEVCGKVFHGNINCKKIVDDFVIDTRKGKFCPKCKEFTIKSDGCNHITCSFKFCEAHWCYCCNELLEDGNSAVTEHFMLSSSRCFGHQFDKRRILNSNLGTTFIFSSVDADGNVCDCPNKSSSDAYDIEEKIRIGIPKYTNTIPPQKILHSMYYYTSKADSSENYELVSISYPNKHFISLKHDYSFIVLHDAISSIDNFYTLLETHEINLFHKFSSNIFYPDKKSEFDNFISLKKKMIIFNSCIDSMFLYFCEDKFIHKLSIKQVAINYIKKVYNTNSEDIVLLNRKLNELQEIFYFTENICKTISESYTGSLPEVKENIHCMFDVIKKVYLSNKNSPDILSTKLKIYTNIFQVISKINKETEKVKNNVNIDFYQNIIKGIILISNFEKKEINKSYELLCLLYNIIKLCNINYIIQKTDLTEVYYKIIQEKLLNALKYNILENQTNDYPKYFKKELLKMQQINKIIHKFYFWKNEYKYYKYLIVEFDFDNLKKYILEYMYLNLLSDKKTNTKTENELNNCSIVIQLFFSDLKDNIENIEMPALTGVDV